MHTAWRFHNLYFYFNEQTLINKNMKDTVVYNVYEQ